MTDLMLEGMVCESCGEFITDEPQGYPQKCDDCE